MDKHLKLPRRGFLSLMVAAVANPQASFADETYPNRPITMVIGFPPGGSTDLTGRIIAEMLRDRLGQPVIIANRPGAAGVTGAIHVSQQAADGYTLLWAPEFDTTTRVMMDGDKLNFSMDRLEMLGGGTSSPYFLIVKSDSPWKTLEDLLAYARSNPGKLTYASAGSGMINNVGVELFLTRLGIKALHVPHKGGAEALQAVLGGVTDVHLSSGGRIKGFLESGAIRALVTFADERARVAPFSGVPTAREKGISLPDLSLFNFLAAPKGLPAATADKLKVAFREGLRDRKHAEKLERVFHSSDFISAEQVQTRQREYSTTMRDILKSLGSGTQK